MGAELPRDEVGQTDQVLEPFFRHDGVQLNVDVGGEERVDPGDGAGVGPGCAGDRVRGRRVGAVERHERAVEPRARESRSERVARRQDGVGLDGDALEPKRLRARDVVDEALIERRLAAALLEVGVASIRSGCCATETGDEC